MVLVVSIVLLAGGAYWIGSRGPEKFIQEYRDFKETAQLQTNQILSEVQTLKQTIITNDLEHAAEVEEFNQTIAVMRSDLRKSNQRLSESISALDLSKDSLEAELPSSCAPVFDLARNYRFQLDTAQVNLTKAESIISEGEKRDSVQNLRIENMRYGFTRLGVATDSLGEIIGNLPEPKSDKIFGIKVSKEIVFIAGAVTGGYLISRLNRE